MTTFTRSLSSSNTVAGLIRLGLGKTSIPFDLRLFIIFSAFHCPLASLGMLFSPFSVATRQAKEIASTIFLPWKAADSAFEKSSTAVFFNTSMTSKRL